MPSAKFLASLFLRLGFLDQRKSLPSTFASFFSSSKLSETTYIDEFFESLDFSLSRFSMVLEKIFLVYFSYSLRQ